MSNIMSKDHRASYFARNVIVGNIIDIKIRLTAEKSYRLERRYLYSTFATLSLDIN